MRCPLRDNRQNHWRAEAYARDISQYSTHCNMDEQVYGNTHRRKVRTKNKPQDARYTKTPTFYVYPTAVSWANPMLGDKPGTVPCNSEQPSGPESHPRVQRQEGQTLHTDKTDRQTACKIWLRGRVRDTSMSYDNVKRQRTRSPAITEPPNCSDMSQSYLRACSTYFVNQNGTTQ